MKVRLFATKITFACLLANLGTSTCAAGELAITVVDHLGRGVSEAVVTAAPVDPRISGVAPARAVMDQKNLAFVPRVLVVAVGASVEFPNNDSVSHQVYSFSPSKRFQLPLYKGERHPPVTFDQKGLVVLGCNIHDEMAGYVYVTDAPFFGKTDENGTLHLPGLTNGDYRLTVWSPLIADPPPTLTSTLRINGQEVTVRRIQLTRDLRARPEPRPRRADWEY